MFNSRVSDTNSKEFDFDDLVQMGLQEEGIQDTMGWTEFPIFIFDINK